MSRGRSAGPNSRPAMVPPGTATARRRAADKGEAAMVIAASLSRSPNVSRGSSDLPDVPVSARLAAGPIVLGLATVLPGVDSLFHRLAAIAAALRLAHDGFGQDRKSTRLNSSH